MTQIHWFSPLPPDRTDIGHFTGRILEALSEHVDVVLWTNTTSPDAALSTFAEVRSIPAGGIPPADLNTADAIFYNLGNHGPFHAAILEQSWRVPGIVILHEADLHGLIAYQWVNQQGRGELYVAEMRRAHGEIGEKTARDRLVGRNVSRSLPTMPLLAPALRNCLGIICHSDMTRVAVAALEIPVLQAELPYGATSLERPAKRTGPLRLVQFGYLNPYRRTLEILDLLARWPHRNAVRFDIYGQLWDEALVRRRIAALGLSELVAIHGFTAEDELDRALSEADLVLNLRFPTLGEASGSQMRIWNAAMPSVVPDLGWFAHLPPDSVLRISSEHEAQELVAILDALLEDRYRFDEIGRRGRTVLENQHAPTAYADIVRQAADEVPKLRRRQGALMTVEAASRVVGRCLLVPAALGKGAIPRVCDLFLERSAALEIDGSPP